MAEIVVLYRIQRTGVLPPPIVCRPWHGPRSRLKGATPARAVREGAQPGLVRGRWPHRGRRGRGPRHGQYQEDVRQEYGLGFLQPGPDWPRIVVLDNTGIHRSRTVRKARANLTVHGIWLWHPSVYSPELNDIERTCRTLRYEAMPRAPLHGHRGHRLSKGQRTAGVFR